MKRILQRIGGTIAMAVGFTGAVLSVLAGVQTWNTAGQLGREIPLALGGVEIVLVSTRQQGTATIALLETARAHTASVRTSLEDLSNGAEDRPDTPPILDVLDEEIARRLDSAEEFVLSMQVSMRSTSSALLLLDSLPFLASLITPAEDPQAGRLTSVAKSLTEGAALLEQVSRTITQARSGQAVGRAQVVQLRETLGRVDGKLAEVQSQIRAFSERAEQTRSSLSALRDDVPRRLNTAAAVITIFFVCFGCSQLSLLLIGYNQVRTVNPARMASNAGS